MDVSEYFKPKYDLNTMSFDDKIKKLKEIYRDTQSCNIKGTDRLFEKGNEAVKVLKTFEVPQEQYHLFTQDLEYLELECRNTSRGVKLSSLVKPNSGHYAEFRKYSDKVNIYIKRCLLSLLNLEPYSSENDYLLRVH